MSSPPVSLTTDPHAHPHVFAAAFNSGDPGLVEQVYEPDGLLVPEPGAEARRERRRAANARLMALGLPIVVQPRHVYVNDDLALLVVDWRIAGTTPEGEPVDVRGTATDVAHRDPDGCWRYAIDNPWGSA